MSFFGKSGATSSLQTGLLNERKALAEPWAPARRGEATIVAGGVPSPKATFPGFFPEPDQKAAFPGFSPDRDTDPQAPETRNFPRFLGDDAPPPEPASSRKPSESGQDADTHMTMAQTAWKWHSTHPTGYDGNPR